MKYRKITAIVRRDVCEEVQAQLQTLGVAGFSLTQVKGYGEYADLYNEGGLTCHARLEIFTEAERAVSVVDAVMAAAHVGLAGDGIIAVLPVESLYRIRTRAPVATD